MRDRPDESSVAPELEDTLLELFRDGHTNALLAWVLVVVLGTVLIESILDVDYRWMLFVGVVGIIVLIPPVAYRDWRVMLPWELLVIALFPILVRGIVGGTVGTFATYLALAGLALLVVVELHMFTSLEVTQFFAVGIVMLTTLAAVAAWTIFRWNADRFLGTTYLLDNETLMLEWLYVTLAGLVAGILFESYFRRRDRQLWRALRQVIQR